MMTSNNVAQKFGYEKMITYLYDMEDKIKRAAEIKADYAKRKKAEIDKISLEDLNIPQLKLINLMLHSNDQSVEILIVDSKGGKQGKIKSVELINV